MSLLTAGTKLTTSLQALQWQPSGMSQTDLGNLNELIKELPPVAGIPGGSNTTQKSSAWLQNGTLFLPSLKDQQGIRVDPGDWIMVDGKGWPIIVPAVIFSTSWQHS